MKLLRYGPIGSERPGVLDRSGAIRDLSGHIAAINSDTLAPESLRRLAAINPETLPVAMMSPGNSRIKWLT